jgi:E3 ubiquitin-protein ligase SHPRH
MIKREGATFDGSQIITAPPVQSPSQDLPPSFHAAKDARGQDCFISDVHRVVLKSQWSLLDYQAELKGGILSEEMGLGKTVELIALVSLHKQPAHLLGQKVNGLVRSPTTLIITPAHILQQWLNELATHAPHLNILHYKGLTGQHADNGPSFPAYDHSTRDYTVEQLMRYDVVLTTFHVLAREIHFAEKPPDRNMRNAPKYKRRRSPLILTRWWRVCLDEAQMIESGVSQAATLARLIPRANAWAVSGTPLKKDFSDLHGLLIFLNYEPFAHSKKSWQRIDKPTLKQILSSIALRHNKHQVAHELQIPPQRRVVVTMPFTAIEEQNYDELYKTMCSSLDLNIDGSPAIGDWNPDLYVDRMRSWLKRLRETCLHPQVGSQNRRALGRGQGPLRTVNEVLEMMISQNHSELFTQERNMILAQVTRAHVVNNDGSKLSRSKDALKLYQDALAKAETIVEECRKECAEEEAKIKEARGAKPDDEKDDGSDSDNDDQGQDAKRLSGPKRQLRSALEALHICTFFVATSYYQMKEMEKSLKETEDTDEYRRLETLEVQQYDRAKAIRRELLSLAHHRATVTMGKVDALQRPGHLTCNIGTMPTLNSSSGIESRNVLAKFNAVSKVLNSQAELINEWRGKIIKHLTGHLVDTEDHQEITGDEYEDSTKLQDELYIYITGLLAIISDRQQCISGEVNFLQEVEFKASIKFAKDGKGHAPDLLLKVADMRKKIRMTPEHSPLQAILSETRSIASSLALGPAGGRGAVEAAILEDQINEIKMITSNQRDLVKALEKEQILFHNCMNERVEYYRQLQELSDQVAPWREELDESLDLDALDAQLETEQVYAARLATLKTKRRFLLHLRAESTQQNEVRICVICTDPFENGVLTVCGHQYCKVCFMAWSRSHHTCPECRKHLSRNDFHEITYKPKQLKMIEEQDTAQTSNTPPPSRNSITASQQSTSATSIYSTMSAEMIGEIESIHLDGSFGTKIDTICRHLLWLREHDAGAKSIIFSQYSDFLEVLRSAMQNFKISAVSIRDPKGVEIFRRDPSKECFLLDAKSDSSGLNLVNATHVFLCEPLVNAAIELQAVARVHRIGQMRETNVYMYLIGDTVEEAIYELSVNRRLSHLGKSTNAESTSRSASRAETPALQETALDKANNLEMQRAPISTLLAKGKNEGELVDRGDLWDCLFGKQRQSGVVSGALQFAVDRHLRADAAEARQSQAGAQT